MIESAARPAKPNRHRQFSMRTMMLTVTALCVLLAIPYGLLMAGTLVVWAAVVSLVAWPMVKFYRPIYRLIAGSSQPH